MHQLLIYTLIFLWEDLLFIPLISPGKLFSWLLERLSRTKLDREEKLVGTVVSWLCERSFKKRNTELMNEWVNKINKLIIPKRYFRILQKLKYWGKKAISEVTCFVTIIYWQFHKSSYINYLNTLWAYYVSNNIAEEN